MKARIFSAAMAAFWTFSFAVNTMFAVSDIMTGRGWVALLTSIMLGTGSLLFGVRRFVILVTGDEP